MSATPQHQYPEDEVVGELLKSSPEFREFYNSVRKKIVGQVAWVLSSSLPEGVNARVTADRDGRFFTIELKHIPAKPEDARRVADELEHCVYDSEGFPAVVPSSPQYRQLAAALNSMLADPIAYSRLKEFGFDLRDDHHRDQQDSRRQIESKPEPSKREDTLQSMVNYASIALESRIIGGDSKCEFQIWFDSKFPNVAHKAKKLLAMINRIGFDTPQAQIVLLQEIIRRYKLEASLRVIP